MKVFAIWFEKHPCKMSKGHGSNVSGFLILPIVTLAKLKHPKRSFARGV
jgi:hypothetical protein